MSCAFCLNLRGGLFGQRFSRDFDKTEAFWHRLGFATSFRNDSWMILSRETLEVEFFPHPDLDPATSWFSACIRLLDIDALHADWATLGISPDAGGKFPRLTDPFELDDAPRMFALLDPDGSLLRVLEDVA